MIEDLLSAFWFEGGKVLCHVTTSERLEPAGLAFMAYLFGCFVTDLCLTDARSRWVPFGRITDTTAGLTGPLCLVDEKLILSIRTIRPLGVLTHPVIKEERRRFLINLRSLDT